MPSSDEISAATLPVSTPARPASEPPAAAEAEPESQPETEQQAEPQTSTEEFSAFPSELEFGTDTSDVSAPYLPITFSAVERKRADEGVPDKHHP